MRSKTDIGQIFLTHPRNENFTTLFTEAFQKQGETVELFAVIELENPAEPHELKLERGTSEKLAGQIIGALKKTYITSPVLDGGTFERALATVNAAIARSLRQTKTRAFTKMNIALAALYRSELFLTVAGNAQVLLWRGGEIADLAQDLAESARGPAKIFQNYSSGGLARRDRVILSTKQLLNYVSLTLLREYLQEDGVAEVCQEIIAALGEQKSVGFATFIFEISSGETVSAAAKAPKTAAAKKPGVYRPALAFAQAVLLAAGDFIWRGVRRLFSRRAGAYRKWIFGLLAVALLALLVNIGIGLVRKTFRQKQSAQTQTIERAEKLVQEAEAALIYNDQKTAVADASEAEKLLAENPKADPNKRQELQKRIDDIKNKLNRAVAVDNPAVLAAFPNVPTELLRSANGILAFNADTGSTAYYDFRTGEARPILKNENVSRLAAAAFVGGDTGYLFLTRDGKYARLDLAADKLVYYDSPGPKGISGAAALGAGEGARLYLLDRAGGQIWRVKMTPAGPAGAEAWFKTGQDLSQVTDIAVDGSIYLLRGGAIDKYWSGEKQTFSLSPVLPEAKEPAGIFTSDQNKFFYVIDAKNSRILIFDKSGKLQKQLKGEKLRDAADLYADEFAKIIYVIAGSELLQIKIP